MKNSLAVLIMTCDAYKDLWDPYIVLYKKYWKNPTINAYFCSDTLNSGYEGFKDIPVGEFIEWSARLKYALSKIEEEYVLLVLDDYYITKPVLEDKLIEQVEIMKKLNAVSCRIFPAPAPNKDLIGYPEYGINEKGQKYRCSTQATIWKKEFLIKIIDESENIWQFEHNVSERSNAYDDLFIGLKIINDKDPHYPYHYLCTAVYKRRWMKEAFVLAKKENLTLKTDFIKPERMIDVWRRKYYVDKPLVYQHIFDFFYSKFK